MEANVAALLKETAPSTLTASQANEKINWIARTIKEKPVFQERAALVAQELGPEAIEVMVSQLHEGFSAPSDIADQFPGLGQWGAVRQAAIFEILYHFREAALPTLRKIAFGPYDWTQANAVDILCRFATEGIEPEAIANDLAADLPNWRYEAILYTINDLARFCVQAPALQSALHDLITEWGEEDPIEALELLEPLAQHAPVVARRYEKMLREIIHAAGLGTRNPLLDGQVVEMETDEGEPILAAASGRQHPSAPDYHAIRAALVFNDLFPNDDEIFPRLQHWAEHHPEEDIRQALAQRLGDAS